MTERILLALDESPASRKVVDYVARLVGAHPDLHLHLLHVAHVPGRHAAEGDPAFEKARREAHEILDGLSERLWAAGVPRERLDSGFLAVSSDVTLLEGLLDVARDQECGTIVVGRNSLPWHREVFHHHAADELVKTARDFTLWVVE